MNLACRNVPGCKDMFVEVVDGACYYMSMVCRTYGCGDGGDAVPHAHPDPLYGQAERLLAH